MHVTSWLRAKNEISGVLKACPVMQLQNYLWWRIFCEIKMSSVSFHLPPKKTDEIFSTVKLLSTDFVFIMWMRQRIHHALPPPFARQNLPLLLHLLGTSIPPSLPPVSLLTVRWLGGESADLLKRQLSCNYRLREKQTVHQSHPPQT